MNELEQMINKHFSLPEPLKARAMAVELLILDVDGVLTNGELFFLETGEYKAFNALDGQGIALLQKAGIEVAIISGSQSNSVKQRFKKFNLNYVYQGVTDKAATYRELRRQLGVAHEAVAYMGDDVIDLPVMTQVGFATSVANAHPIVKQYAHWVSQYEGGRGAVREVADVILEAKGLLLPMLESYLHKPLPI